MKLIFKEPWVSDTLNIKCIHICIQHVDLSSSESVHPAHPEYSAG